jgi:hypothetical protein
MECFGELTPEFSTQGFFMYTIERRHVSSMYWMQCIVSPTGEVIRKYGDSKLRDAEELVKLLNAAYELGKAAKP